MAQERLQVQMSLSRSRDNASEGGSCPRRSKQQRKTTKEQHRQVSQKRVRATKAHDKIGIGRGRSRSLALTRRPLSAGKGRSRRRQGLACSTSGPLLTPHTRRQGYFRPRSRDTSRLGAFSPFQTRSTLAFAEHSCLCLSTLQSTAPRAAKCTILTQCLCATPYAGTVSSPDLR